MRAVVPGRAEAIKPDTAAEAVTEASAAAVATASRGEALMDRSESRWIWAAAAEQVPAVRVVVRSG